MPGSQLHVLPLRGTVPPQASEPCLFRSKALSRRIASFQYQIKWTCISIPICAIVVCMKPDRLTELLSTWSAHTGPLHTRLSQALESLITEGSLLPGVRLPAERVLAKSLGVSRTTVVSSYNTLREAGWLESRGGSGTWVSRKQAATARSWSHSGVVARGSMLTLLQGDNSALIDLAIATTEPLAEMVKLASIRAQEEISRLIAQRNYMPFGLTSLRQAIASFYASTGLPTAMDQILVTSGAQQAISLITSLFVHRGDPVLVENPTYFGALECFRFAGARLVPLAVTKDHVKPELLRRRISAVQRDSYTSVRRVRIRLASSCPRQHGNKSHPMLASTRYRSSKMKRLLIFCLEVESLHASPLTIQKPKC